MIWTLSSGETIISTPEPRIVSEEIILAYERRTGFHGFGEYLESLGEITIIREKKC